MTLAPADDHLIPRGVYRAPFLTADGREIFLAIDYRHRRVAIREVPLGDDPITIFADLWHHLDALDPEHSRRLATRNAAKIAGLALLVLPSLSLFAG